jgi:hypothetical protein
MITWIGVSLMAGWLVGIGVPSLVGCGLGDTAGSTTGVDGMMVGGEFVGAAIVAVGGGCTTVCGVAVGVAAQAASKIAVKLSMINRFWGTAIFPVDKRSFRTDEIIACIVRR